MSGPVLILVIGAINQDDVARVAVAPRPGETVVTDSIETFPGGKGANQAAAAAQSGRAVRVVLLGAVGDDAAGETQLAALAAAGVEVGLIRSVMGTATGRALITVSADGENSIVVGLGANAFVSPVNVNGAPTPHVAIGQTEIGAAAVDALARVAHDAGCRFIVNNAPVVDLQLATLTAADPLIVNEHEALAMLPSADRPIPPISPWSLANSLFNTVSPRSLVVTLGSAGCVLVDNSGVRSIAAYPADSVVDTTGAGDTFVGVLAAALADGLDLNSAAEAASRAAAEAVAWQGARRPLLITPTP